MYGQHSDRHRLALQDVLLLPLLLPVHCLHGKKNADVLHSFRVGHTSKYTLVVPLDNHWPQQLT